MQEINKILKSIDEASVGIITLMRLVGRPYSPSEPEDRAGHPQLEATLQHLAEAAREVQAFGRGSSK